jgi:hypothetical protein
MMKTEKGIRPGWFFVINFFFGISFCLDAAAMYR